MANPEHLAILKQGVEVWNQWRMEYPDIKPDLKDTDILNSEEFREANLREADLRDADLTGVNLNSANLCGANLTYTKLGVSVLSGANLSSANLTSADLSGANLNSANLSGVDLEATIFNETDLDRTNFNKARTTMTIFVDVDLSVAKGLDTVKYDGPSNIGINTIIRSHGNIPESFLRGVGVPPSIIEQIPALISSLKPIDYYSCFISYSSKVEDFAKRIYADLQSSGVRCWFAPHDLRPGQRIRHGIDEAIRLYDKLLLILSEYSVASTWVEFEVEAAMDKEKNGCEVLFPVRLDSAVLECTVPWATHLKRTRHIGDFTKWKDHDEYQQVFNRLLRDLKAEAKKSKT